MRPIHATKQSHSSQHIRFDEVARAGEPGAGGTGPDISQISLLFVNLDTLPIVQCLTNPPDPKWHDLKASMDLYGTLGSKESKACNDTAWQAIVKEKFYTPAPGTKLPTAACHSRCCLNRVWIEERALRLSNGYSMIFLGTSWGILGVMMGNDEWLIMKIGSVPWLQVLSLPSLPMDPRKVGRLGVP